MYHGRILKNIVRGMIVFLPVVVAYVAIIYMVLGISYFLLSPRTWVRTIFSLFDLAPAYFPFAVEELWDETKKQTLSRLPR